jgi:urea transporter
MLYSKLLCHFIGNTLVWVFNFGAKSIDEVVKKDNSWLGLIILITIVLAFYSKT